MKHRLSNNRHRRLGVTLTQMLVVITITTVITSVAISLIITMLRLEGRTMQVWMTQQSLLQLSDDFRADAHAAQSAEITTQNQAPALIFRSGSATKTVTYVATDNEVARHERDGDRVLRSETYRLPESKVRFSAIGSGEKLDLGQDVHLICRRANAEAINQLTPAPTHDEHVVAVLGRDHRFENRGSPTSELKP